MKSHIRRRTISLVVTNRCNLTCPYCYVSHGNERMSFKVAKAAIDFALQYYDDDEVVFDFIGGEPLLEVELLQGIVRYVHCQCRQRNHRWSKHHAFSISTNGTLYGTAAVQELLRESCVDVSITVDGDVAMHDANRVYGNGRGSYTDVVANVPAWLARSGPKASTKVTLAPSNLRLFPDGIFHLLQDLKIPKVHANVVFENVWRPGDEDLYEHQLLTLGRAMLAAGIPLQRCSLFDRRIGTFCQGDELQQNWCGTGKHMIAVDMDGKLYPCNRFVPTCLAKREARPVGDVWNGIDEKALAPYLELCRTTKFPPECLRCDVSRGCAWCSGFDYDEFGDLTHRATYLCALHRARVRANRTLWAAVPDPVAGPGVAGTATPVLD